ncbi:MAG: S41 family peptidase [Halodesulfovibrio sp.]
MRMTMWVASAASLAILAFSCVPGLATEDQSKFDSLKRFSQVLDMVERFYVNDVSRKDLIDGAMRGMLQSLDPHSTYMDPKEQQEMQETTSGEFFGIGIEITQDENGILKVVAPIEDTPAWKGGLKSGDLILEVDGESTQEMSLAKAVSKIKGPKGSAVMLTVLSKSDKEPKEVKLVRDVIPLISVKTRVLDDGYLWVRLMRFSERTTDELYEKIGEYTKNHELQGIILDLRDNPGGLLDQSISVSDAFLSEGVVVSIRGRGKDSREFNARAQESDITVPMTVLINAGSASASEIVAGALRDQKRALLIGERSFGKGSVQNIIPLSDGGAVKLTIARYYTPNGTSIQAEGIQPDILMPFEAPREEDKAHPRRFMREKDLSGHLENPNGNGDSGKPAFKRSPEATEALTRDNQLRLALQLVRSLPRIQTIH